jgi:hypothetical protein
MSNQDTFWRKAAKVALGILLMALVTFAIGFSLEYFLGRTDGKYRFSEAVSAGLLFFMITLGSGLFYIKWWK